VRAAGIALAVPALVVGACEVAHFAASRSGRAGIDPQRPAALVVLGCPTTRRGRLTAMQRWRVDIAVRSFRRAPASRVVFTGAAWKQGRSESEAMAAYARRLGVPEAAILLERRSRSTWENIEQALVMVGDAEQLAICSDPVHAARGRRCVVRQRPDLAPRLVVADDHRVLEHPLLKLVSVGYEVPRMLYNRSRWLLRFR
jgi:uncharacterized SAM-binding protein YcdF (DUF218 family)